MCATEFWFGLFFVQKNVATSGSTVLPAGIRRVEKGGKDGEAEAALGEAAPARTVHEDSPPCAFPCLLHPIFPILSCAYY